MKTISFIFISFLCSNTFFGQAQLVHDWEGEFQFDEFGRSVSSGGDVNRDGYVDWIVGAPNHDAATSTDKGQAYVYSGADGTLLYEFLGEEVYDYFGYSVSGAGDVNGDGYVDWIVGAPYYDAATINSGKAYVYSGADGTLLHGFDGEGAYDYFGYSVSGAGDVNNDGYDDVIIGAYGNDSNGYRSGKAYVYSGVDGTLLYDFSGEAVYDYFGRSVSGAGDVNGDGFDDLVIGASGVNSDAGKVHVYSGVDGLLLYEWLGEASYDNFGCSVSGSSDVNNDGHDDVVIGAYGVNDYAGSAYVYSGVDGALLYEWHGQAASDIFGFSVFSGCDVNNDGHSDVVVGAPYSNSYAGSVYVYSGVDGALLEE